MDNKMKVGMQADFALLGFVALMFISAIVTALTPPLILGATYLVVTIALILVSYFFGLLAGLVGSLVFVFGQVLYVITWVQHHELHDLPVMLFWLIVPVLGVVLIDRMTVHQRQLQADNQQLQADLIERGAFDKTTSLRTMVAYLQDLGVFVETNRRYQLPVSTLVIQVRYYPDLVRMMGDARIHALIQTTTKAVSAATRTNDIVYMLDADNPTWGVLLYSDGAGAEIAANRIKAKFAQVVAQSGELSGIDLSLKTGIAQWNPEDQVEPREFMNSAVKQLEYDVI